MARTLTPAADAYKMSSTYLSDDNDDVDIPVDPFELARIRGVEVLYDNDLPLDISGYLDWDDEGAFIVINGNHHLNRQRFTCAHEMGHHTDILNHDLERERSHRDRESSRGTNIREVYANRFAAALLMPADAVRSRFEGTTDVGELARIFRVSSESMRIRLKNLRLVQ
ncbi:ImmA/IrrE family metallo-endopeptidase [Corynebacterium variabile]|uniref:ImmA/IrrE family metallo-endopeptidase n=1 Tax=Corynebacterium variabile TaxID=1727 RepID=UPI003BB61EA6